MVSFDSPFYPYEKEYPGHTTFRGIEDIPQKIIFYLLDLPDKAGYIPKDDNERPRVRLAKYLWHDGARPLDERLPTPEEKLSMLFDPSQPDLATDEQREKHPKGYRIFPQIFWGQSQTEAQTTLKVYMGRTKAQTPVMAELGVVFQILSNSNLESNARSVAYSRCYAMEQAILEALHGVNISGVGAFNFESKGFYDTGSRPINDEGTNVGRELYMSLSWADGGSVWESDDM